MATIEAKPKPGIYREGEILVFSTIEFGRWHVSLSHQTRMPTYEEIKHIRYKYAPDNITMGELFPPKAEFVNLHHFCRHLWQI